MASFDPDGGGLPPVGHVSGDLLRITNRIGFGRNPAAKESFLAVFEAPGLASGRTGTFPIRRAWTEQAGGFASMILPDESRSGWGSVHVAESSEAAVEGRVGAWLAVFSREARLLDGDEMFHVPVDASFRAVRGSNLEGAADPGGDLPQCMGEAAGWGSSQ